MKQETILKCLNILQNACKSNMSFFEYCKKYKINYSSISKTIHRIKKHIKEENADKVIQLYNGIKTAKKKTQIDCIRDKDGKIAMYSYKIYPKNDSPIIGTFTREEMNSIYRMYSYYGDGLTQHSIVRHFPDIPIKDFKKILHAFKITKTCTPFAPHMIEELSEEELTNIQLREKENHLLHKIEEEQINNNTNLLKKYIQENTELKTKINNINNLFKELINYQELDTCKLTFTNPKSNLDHIIIFLSDMHIGAYNEKYGYIQLENYDEEEITRRLSCIVSYLASKKYASITICNLGDSVDSFNKLTTRGGHELPTIMSNKEQSILYQNIMYNFFYNLKQINNNIQYICVGESNHDGDWGWINNILLAQKIQDTLKIDTYISDKPIDQFDIKDVSIIILHGKDSKNQFKGFPLHLDVKTETWFNNYFIDSNIDFKNKKAVIKGDLHQYAYSRAKHFDYISAPSLYGSSNWIVANFGKTNWGVLYMEISNNNDIRTGVISD
jgi:hypothetical protein